MDKQVMCGFCTGTTVCLAKLFGERTDITQQLWDLALQVTLVLELSSRASTPLSRDKAKALDFGLTFL